MELLQAIQGRRSIRRYQDRDVPPESVRELIDAARLAPSGANSQPWRFVAVRSAEKRKALRDGTVRFAADAPLVIACCVDLDAYRDVGRLGAEMRANGMFDGVDATTAVFDEFVRTEKPLTEAALRSYCMFNSAFAMENLVLRAHDLGLGACIVAMFNQQIVREILELPDNVVITALIAVGYPAQSPAARPRLALEEVFLKEI